MIKQYLDLIIVAIILIAIAMYDVTMEFLEEFFHLIFEVLHNLFEWVELGVEEVVERVFHWLHIGGAVAYLFITERHGSQVVTFYILMSAICYALFRLSIFVPRIHDRLKQLVLVAWVRRKTQVLLFWRSQSRAQKTAVVLTAIGFAYLASFFVM